MTSTARAARRLATTGLAAALLAGGLGLAAVAPASAAPVNDPASCNYMGYQSGPDQLGLTFDVQEQQMFTAINAYRAQNGLKALKPSKALARPAMWMALDSVRRTDDVKDHVDSRGMDPQTRVGVCSNNAAYSSYQGEILRWRSGGNKATAVDDALTWWKNSPGHNARMLDPNAKTMSVAWAYIGVDAEVKYYWCVDFGR